MGNQDTNVELTIITGMSGAGKTVVMQCLEDIGFFCIDNLPTIVIQEVLETMLPAMDEPYKIAIVTDMRGRLFFEQLPEILQKLHDIKQINLRVIFLEAKDETLVRRYQETRRIHPLAINKSSLAGIVQERELLKEIRSVSDYVIDTSNLKARDLQKKVRHIFEMEEKNNFQLMLTSFGFKHGLPIEVDFVFDVRCLLNPFYIAELRPLTGLDEEVFSYVCSAKGTSTYVAKLLDFLDYIVPTYLAEGKRQLIIAIGCTGGQHRSIAVTEILKKHFESQYYVTTNHRDIKKKKLQLHE